MMQISTTPVEELTYEQAFAELESIVAALEANQVALDAALSLFERGQILAQYCGRLLETAELRVRQLTVLPPEAPDDDYPG